MALRPRNGLSLCSGGGGLDLGLMLAEPGFHSRCFVEWDEYPRRTLIAAQRAGYLAPAPIWGDLTTFDARPFAGAIDTLLAGYPCQPFSAAGQRRGTDDPRHLWPHVARVARELDDGLEWIFLENVAGHITLGLETVLRELWDLGFTPATGAFSAAETGASHERLRVFIVGHRPSGAGRLHARSGEPGCAAPDPGRSNGELADPGKPRPQGAERPGAPAERHRPSAHGSTPERGGAWIYPPGPGDRAAWSAVMAADPSRAPAVARSDAAAAALRLAAVVPADTAHAILERAGDVAIGEIVRAVEREAPGLVGLETALAGFRLMAHGMAARSRALQLLGNGVVPLVAAYAWRTLAASHGLMCLDLEAPEWPGTAVA